MSSKKKQKQLSLEEYIENYCQEKRIRGRFAVYISPETHRNLRSIARLFNGKHHTTTSSLTDAIISHHIKTYRELLDEVQKEDDREFLEWLLKEKEYSESNDEESEFDQEEDKSV